MGDLESRANEEAATFVKLRTPEFLRRFLIESGLNRNLYRYYLSHTEAADCISIQQFTEHLVADHFDSFGQAIGDAYALGFCDNLEHALETEPDEDSDQLSLPGILD